MSRLKYRVLCLLVTCCFSPLLEAQSLSSRLSAIPGIQFMARPNTFFKEYYEVVLSQPVDHTNPSGKKFRQRIFIGFRDFTAPVVFQPDGYSAGYASMPGYYPSELSKELNANQVLVEHRFFSQSVPDTLDWNFLTVWQAADDYHAIKLMLDTILTGKWLSTGISKGGQAALAYKMVYPDDVVATVLYGTAVKDSPFTAADSMLRELSQTPCGKKLSQLQLFAFRNKQELLPLFRANSHRDFTPLDPETVFDYMLLELPFSFWQNGKDCESIPDTSAPQSEIVGFIMQVVPPYYFTGAVLEKQVPAFYMFYHELGYYEYSTEQFRPWLKQADYTNSRFAPENVSIRFDSTFQQQVPVFLKTKEAENVFFIYGENDPWAFRAKAGATVFIVPGGNHRSRIFDLPGEQKAAVYGKIGERLK